MKKTPLVQTLHRLVVEAEEGDLTLGEIFEILKESGHSVLILFLSLPFLQPVPLAGLSTPFGILITIAAFRQFRHQPPWFPKRWAHKDLSYHHLKKILEMAERAAAKATPWLHPRFPWFLENPGWRWANFLTVAISAFLLALPLPIPFSNTVPAITIVVHSIGQLEDDGLFIGISYALVLICSALFVAVGWGVQNGVEVLNLSF